MNIIEILKKCPKGTKLYSPIFGECTLNKIISKDTFSVISNNSTLHFFFCDGRCTNDGECCIFPSKEERDWNKFQIPYVYKNGDIVYLKTKNGRKYVIIIKNIEDDYLRSHIDWWVGSSIWFSDTSFNIEDIEEHRFATETEKQKLFKELKVNGYRWNAETKTLEKLIVPKFKVGDKIKHKETGDVYKILFTLSDGEGGGVYDVSITNEIAKSIDVKEQDNYELVPDKFDITTLVPFESKVLVRHTKKDIWRPAIFGGYIDNCSDDYKYIVMGESFYKYLIPYEGNEHLLCTDNDCNNYYKTWE